MEPESPRHTARHATRRTAGRWRRSTALVTAALLGLGALGIAAPALLPTAVAAPLGPLDLAPAAVPASPSPEQTADPVPRAPAAPPAPAPAVPAATVAPAAPEPSASAGPSSRPAEDVALERRVVELVNRYRAVAGCPALRVDRRLDAAALGHSRDMARRDYFDHTGLDGSTPWTRARRAGYDTPSAENIAFGYRTAEEAVRAWLDSPGHRRNLLDCTSRAVGTGVARGDSEGIYWTQLFGRE
jgi:uncharacterized protein YkwD